MTHASDLKYPKPLFFGPCQKSNPGYTKSEALIYNGLILNLSIGQLAHVT